MAQTFFFYDLETSGLDARSQRIMQFAGQRTDMDLQPVGEPVNLLVCLSDDILPEPSAIMVTGITPQKTLEEGISEPEFVKILSEQVFTPDTIIVGFNNIRFDDEFVRFALWRNFYDPYEWCYKDGRSRWDMLDVVRMTRALRPDSIVWPVDKKGQPTNRLEELATANHFDHTHAHDALSDVMATIQLAQLIKQKQPKLFDYLLDLRHKAKVSQLVNLDHPEPFVYSSGRYGKDKSFTTIGLPIAPASRDGGVVIYDLSVNPEPFFELNDSQLKEKLFASYEQRTQPDFVGLPVKELFYNKAPAVAPISVMNDVSWQRLGLDKAAVMKHAGTLAQHADFAQKLASVYRQKPAFAANADVEGQLYDGFTNDTDKPRLAVIQAADAKTLADFNPDFKDKRLGELFVRYKARNFPQALSEDEQQTWEAHRSQKFAQAGPRFMQDLQKLAAQSVGDENTQFLIEELRLWCESVAPLE